MYNNEMKNSNGFTVIELMITLAIVAIIFAASYGSMSGYIPKQRLLTTQRYIENILQRAQSEAYSRSAVVGVHFKPGTPPTGELFIDANGNGVQESSEGALTSMQFREGIFFTATNCKGINFGIGVPPECDAATSDCYVMFNNSGQAVDPATLSQTVDYQLFIYSTALATAPVSPINTREVEVLSSGLVESIKQGQDGNASPPKTAAVCAQ